MLWGRESPKRPAAGQARDLLCLPPSGIFLFISGILSFFGFPFKKKKIGKEKNQEGTTIQPLSANFQRLNEAFFSHFLVPNPNLALGL